MSGSSSSGSGFDNWRSTDGGTKPGGSGGGDGGGDHDKCAIFETTILASPVASVIATLHAGDILLLELETTPRSRVVAKTATGAIAGAITSIRLVDMIECMQAGFMYQAEVRAISGGKVTVEIRPA